MLTRPLRVTCRLYGRVLNLNRVGITCKGSGCFFDRCSKVGFLHSNRGKGGFVVPGRVTLAVEDPIDPTNDTARGSYNMKTVRQVGVCVGAGRWEVAGLICSTRRTSCSRTGLAWFSFACIACTIILRYTILTVLELWTL
jgi:hypothetical protein